MLLSGNFNGVAHLGVPVYDAEQTSKWYQDTLGFELVNEASLIMPEGTVEIKFLACGSMLLELFQLFGEAREQVKVLNHGLHDHFAILTTNLDKVYEELKYKGVPIEEEPSKARGYWSGKGIRYLTLLSNNGERIKLVERLDRKSQVGGFNIGDWSHLRVFVSSIEKSKAFYDQFGFKETFTFRTEGGNDVSLIEYNGFTLELFEDREEAAKRSRGRIDHIAFSVRNQNEAYEELKRTGFEIFEEAPVLQPSVWHNGVFYFITAGPDGEGIEFNHRVIDEGEAI